MKPTCVMCKKKPVKKLTATLGNSVYINGRDILIFCSMRCAANYGLVWGAAEVESCQHFCSVTGEWVHCDKSECDKCVMEEIEQV